MAEGAPALSPPAPPPGAGVPTAGPPPVATRRLGRIDGLDGMRGIAALVVVVAHFNIILPIPSLVAVPGGTVPLDMFFVLSGFLITTLLLREQAKSGRVQRWAFYERRILRLVPALVVMLCAQAVLAALIHVSFHQEWTSLTSVLFYYSNWKLALHSNYFGGNIANGLQHMWSLSFEEQFYLIWPWVTVAALTIRARLRTVVIVLVALMVAIDVHQALFYTGPQTWYADFIRTDTRASSILMGALLAHIWIRGRAPRRYVPLVASAAALFLVVCLPFADPTGAFLYRGGLVAIDLACAVLVLAVVDGAWRGRHFFQLKPLVAVGIVSYGVYLWHLPVLFAVQYYGKGWSDVARVAVVVGATAALATASWFLIERPCMRLRLRLSPVEGAPAPAPAGGRTPAATPLGDPPPGPGRRSVTSAGLLAPAPAPAPAAAGPAPGPPPPPRPEGAPDPAGRPPPRPARYPAVRAATNGADVLSGPARPPDPGGRTDHHEATTPARG